MHTQCLHRFQLVPQLPDSLHERQRLDIAYGAANLAQDEVEIALIRQSKILDRIGYMRDHLNGGAQIIAAPLAGNNVLINTA